MPLCHIHWNHKPHFQVTHSVKPCYFWTQTSLSFHLFIRYLFSQYWMAGLGITFCLSQFSDTLAVCYWLAVAFIWNKLQNAFKFLTFNFFSYIFFTLFFQGNESPCLLDEERQPNGWVGFNFHASGIQTWFALSCGIIWYSE